MKFTRLFAKFALLFVFLLGAINTQAQLLDFMKKKKKSKEEPQTEQVIQEMPVTPEKKFTYRCFTLNEDLERETIDSCLQKFAKKTFTDMNYYEQGEDIRYKEKNNSNVTLSFLDDSKRLIAITVEEIEDVSTIQRLQQLILSEMGEPTQGYELMKNYDGETNTTWTDYSTYEFVYRYVFGTQAYEFHITQYGVNLKNKKVIHPYTFSAVVSKKSELPNGNDKEKPSKKSAKESFYPAEGVTQYNGFAVEVKLLRKW